MTSVDDNERTVLHNAVNMEQSNVTTEFLELLLDHNVDVFALDADGRLPLVGIVVLDDTSVRVHCADRTLQTISAMITGAGAGAATAQV